jgi:hypothetical protein
VWVVEDGLRVSRASRRRTCCGWSSTQPRPGKAAVNAPHSRRFARFEGPGLSRQRLECGGFSTALVGNSSTQRRNNTTAPRNLSRRDCVLQPSVAATQERLRGWRIGDGKPTPKRVEACTLLRAPPASPTDGTASEAIHVWQNHAESTSFLFPLLGALALKRENSSSTLRKYSSRPIRRYLNTMSMLPSSPMIIRA